MIGFVGEGEVTTVDVQHRTHKRTCFRVVAEQRSQLQTDAVRGEWRCERVKHLLRQRPWDGLVFIAHAEKSISHAHVEFSRTRYLQSQSMKSTATSARIEGHIVRPIADQVISFLIFHHASNAAAQIIRISDGYAAGLARQKVEARLRFKGLVPAAG